MELIQIRNKKPGKLARWLRSGRALRHAVMLFFFLFLVRIAWEHQVKGGGPNGSPSIEAYCPFGGVESLYQFLTTGGFVRRMEPSAMILLVAVLLLTLLFSRGFCGWICPFGSLQEWIGLAGKKLFGRRFNPSGRMDRALRPLKYVVLTVIVILSWYLGALVFRPYDPFLAFFHLGRGIAEMPWAYAGLAVVLIGSLRYERFFCKYACPLGAVIGLVSRLGLTRIQRHPENCRECNVCQKSCFAHVDFLNTTTIRDADCNHCLECVTACPKPNVLAVRGASWRFSHGTYAAVLLLGLATTVGVSKVAGYWRTKPAMVAFTDSTGKLDAAQMRGWMTLEEISRGFQIPLSALYEGVHLPASALPSTRVNQIANTYKLTFEPEQLRDFVAAWLAGSPSAGPKRNDKPAGANHTGEEIRGVMTLNEVVAKTGVPKDFLLKKLGAPTSTNPRMPIRDWIHDQGKTMQDVRAAVTEFRAGAR